MDERSTWGEDDSQAFVSRGDYFVPCRETQFGVLCDLAACADGGLMVDLGCGAGALIEALRARYRGSRFVAVDASETMIASVVERFAGDDSVRALAVRLEQYPEGLDERPAAVLSSLAIHHLDGDGKRTLFRRVHDTLVEGGVFAFVDLIDPADGSAKALAARAWDDEVVRRSSVAAQPDEVVSTFRDDGWNMYALGEYDPEDQPSTVVEQLDWLRDAGFERVDVVWMYAGHTIFAAWKRGTAS